MKILQGCFLAKMARRLNLPGHPPDVQSGGGLGSVSQAKWARKRRHVLESLEARQMLTVVDPVGQPGGPGNDPAEISIADVSVNEEGTAAEITVVSSNASQSIDVDWATSNGTATAGADYTASSGTYSIPMVAPVGSYSFTIPISSDTLKESGETFYVTLSNPASGTIVDGIGVVTIIDDDADTFTRDIDRFLGGGQALHSGASATTHPLPGGLSLQYSSLTNERAILDIRTVQPDNSAVPSEIQAELVVDGTSVRTIHYETTGLSAGDPQRFVFDVDGSAIGGGTGSGTFPYELRITETIGSHESFRTLAGMVDIHDQSGSDFGSGWQLSGLEQLVVDSDWVTMLWSDGGVVSYWQDDMTDTEPTAAWQDPPPGSDPIENSVYGGLREKSDGTFVFTSRNREQIFFDTNGRITSRNDRNLNSIQYTFDGLGSLSKITYQDGREVDFTYSGDWLSTVTDWAGRTATLTHDLNGQLTRITDHDPDGIGGLAAAQTDFDYWSASGLLKEIENALDNKTTFDYDAFERLTTVTEPGSAVYAYEPLIVDGLIASGSGTSASPASLPDVSPIGTLTDPLMRTTSGSFNANGSPITQTDGLGNTTNWVYNDNGFATSVTLPDPDGTGPLAAPVTLYAYDNNHNIDELTQPDGTTLEFQYDPIWNVPTRIEDAQGNFTIHTLDAQGNVTQTRRVVGNVDDSGNGETDDVVTNFTFTTNPTAVGQLAGGMPLTITDALGVETTYQYGTDDTLTSFGQITSVTSADGETEETTTTYAYDADWLLASITDGLGNVTSLDYDDLGRLTGTTYADPDGVGPLTSPTSSQTYNLMGQVLTETDPLGNVTAYTYDTRNRLSTTTTPDPDGAGPIAAAVTTLNYDSAGQNTSVTDALGNVTTFAYDDAGQMTSITYADPDGAGPLVSPVQTFGYDDLGRATSETNPLGQATTFVYDVMSRMTSETLPDPDGTGPLTAPVWTTTYNDNGLPISSIDPLGRVTTFEYDSLDRLVKTVYPDPDAAGPLTSPETETTYDKLGNVLTTIDPLGAVTSFSYDKLNRATGVTLPDPDGVGPLAAPVTSVAYDAAGRMTSSTDEFGSVTSFAYDALGQMTSVTSPDPDGTGPLAAPVHSYVYDLNGRVTSSTDPLGKTTDTTYDGLGQVISVAQPDPDGVGTLTRPTTQYAYDLLGQITSLTDPVGNVTSWTYDDLGRMTAETSPLLDDRLYEYDVAGRLAQSTNRNGDVIEFQYDHLNRMTAEIWKDGAATLRTLSFSYDTNGNMATAADPSAGYSFGYDNLDRLSWMHTAYSPGGGSFQNDYEYDTAGQRTALALKVDTGSGWVADLENTYAYDSLGRMTSVVQAQQSGGNAVAPKRVEFSYTTDGRFQNIDRYAATTASPGTAVAQTDYTYDALRRLTSLEHLDGVTSIADYDYTYDVASRITQQAATSLVGLSGTSDFSYDDTDQVTGATHTHFTDESYSFDENGNRTGASTTGTWNRLTNDGTFTYTYDAEGNRTGKTRISTASADDYETIFDWDHRNRLTSIISKDNVGTITKQVDYEYDVFNDRVAKIIDTDGADPAASVTTRYVYDGDNILAIVDDSGDVQQRILHGPSVDQILAIEEDSTGETLWALADHLGSVRDIVDDTGAVENHIVYDAYGNVVSETAAAVDFIYGFTGRERDEESGLNFHRARYLDPATGKWLSHDPIGFAAGDANLYRYVGNGPMNARDPSGLIADTAWDAANVAIGVGSLVYNVSEGAYFDATIDAVGIVVDSAATLVPFVPGGAATGIKVARAADKGIDAIRAGDKAKDAAKVAKAPDGVVYKRTDINGGVEPYGGQAESLERFAQRQKEHARAHPDADFDFEIVDRAVPGEPLDIAEHNFIQELTGGVRAKYSPDVSNLKDPVGKARRPGLGLPEPRDPRK